MGTLHNLMLEPPPQPSRQTRRSPNASMQPPKRACDACHRRKIKCQGTQSCKQCLSARLECTYLAVPQKKGPKPFRMKNQVRESNCAVKHQHHQQHQHQHGHQPVQKPHPLLLDMVWRRLSGVDVAAQPAVFSPGFLTLVDDGTVGRCIEFFYDTLYARMPVLDRQTMQRQVDLMYQCPEAYCVVLSLCSLSMLQLGVQRDHSSRRGNEVKQTASPKMMVEEVLRVMDNTSQEGPAAPFPRLATKYFLSAYYHVHSNYNKAWYHLREGATMMCLGGMDDEEYYLEVDPAEAAHRRNLYWLYCTAERAYALRHQLPVTLQPTIDRPSSSDSTSDPGADTSSNISSFILLLDIYRPFDEPFVNIWKKTCERVPQEQLRDLWQELIARTDSDSTSLNERVSHSDKLNKTWLTDTFWQLSTYRVDTHRRDRGSSANGDEDEIAAHERPVWETQQKLAKLMAQFPCSSAQLIESCFVENLLITAYWIMELLLQLLESMPSDQGEDSECVTGTRLHLDHMFRIVGMIREDHRFLPLLLDKVNKVIPYLINPIL